MKEREWKILEYIVEHTGVALKELLLTFHVSKRTLYYDIEAINFYIRGYGQVKNINRSFCYIGNHHSLREILNHMQNSYLSNENREHYIVYKMLNNERITIHGLASELGLSKNTIVQIIDDLRTHLLQSHLHMISKPRYQIEGKEEIIRNLFITLMQEDNNILNSIAPDVLAFDKAYDLQLTDYSLAMLSKFKKFVLSRIQQGFQIHMMEQMESILAFPHEQGIRHLLENADLKEVVYVSAYVASLPSLKEGSEIETIDGYVSLLIRRFEMHSAIVLDRKKEFERNMKRHLMSSYYRIKYHFPICNPSLEDIKIKYEALFTMIKRILQNETDFPVFKGIKDEEIGFITAYFGGYLKRGGAKTRKNKVLLVCPHGLMVSKSLEVQLYTYIPTIDIVGIIALKDLKDVHETYDYIVSTIDIDGYNNVLVVNPLLTKFDIDNLMEKLLNIHKDYERIDIKKMMEVVKQNATIHNEEKLRKALESVVYKTEVKEQSQRMLKEFITKDKIVIRKHVADWKEAIHIAAQPLLLDGSIEESYIQQMIESVLNYGPYIVLTDRFALPHASGGKGVNRTSMSLLVVEEEVDLLGKPVNLFAVLATVDNTSHMRALSSLTEILYDQKNIECICKGNKDDIMKLIEQAE